MISIQYNMNMNNHKSILLALIATTSVIVGTVGTSEAFAQITPPPLEVDKPAETAAETTSLGKVTIQISDTEQIVLDLPLKDGNTYKKVPIK